MYTERIIKEISEKKTAEIFSEYNCPNEWDNYFILTNFYTMIKYFLK